MGGVCHAIRPFKIRDEGLLPMKGACKEFYVAASREKDKIPYLMEPATRTSVGAVLFSAILVIRTGGAAFASQTDDMQSVPSDTNAIVAEIVQVTERIRQLTSEQARMRAELDARKNVALTNNQQIIRLNRELAELNLKFMERFKEIPELAAAIDSFAALEAEEQALSERHRVTFEKLSAARKKRGLGDTSEELGKEIEELEKQMEEMDRRLISLPGEKKELSRKIAELKKIAGETDDVCRTLREENAEIQKRINEIMLREAVSDKEQQKYDRLEEEILKLARRRTALRKALARACGENEAVVHDSNCGGREMPAGENQGS